MERRTFLKTTAVGHYRAAILGARGQGGNETSGARARATHLRGPSRLGRTAEEHRIRQYPRRGGGFAGANLRAPHRPRRQREPRLHGGLRREGQVRQVAGARSSRAARTGCTSARRAAPSTSICATPRAAGGEDDAERREGLHARLPGSVRSVQAGRRRQEAQVQPDQSRDRAERRYLRRRRLRLELHQSVQQQGRVHPHFRRQGQGGRQAGLPARHHRGHARRRRRS